MVRKRLGRVATIPFLLVSSVFFLFPIYWTITMAFKQRHQILVKTPEWFPQSWHIDNFIEIFQRGSVGTYFFNSIVVSLVTVALTLLVSSMGAYGLARFKFRGKTTIAYSIFVVRVVPPLVYMMPFYIMFKAIGLTDSLAGLVLVYVTLALPLAIWLFIGFFEEIPQAVFEAGLIDGCSEYSLYFRIALPLVSTGMVVVALFTFLAAWNEFSLALVLTNHDANKTLPIGINTMIMNQKERPYGFLAASGTVAMLPAIILALTTQKYMVQGLTAGAIKG